MRAIRAGHLYTAVDARRDAAVVRVHGDATQTARRARATSSTAGGPVTLRVRSNAPPAFTATVWNGAQILGSEHHEQDFTVQAACREPGVYWVEIRAPGRPRGAWRGRTTVTVAALDPQQPDLRPRRRRSRRARPRGRRRPSASRCSMASSADGWRAEHDPTSLAAVETAPMVGGAELRLPLRAGRRPLARAESPRSPSTRPAGSRHTIGSRSRFARERPMRISVQLRIGDAGDRWSAAAIYVDTGARRADDLLRRLHAGRRHRTPRPPLGEIRSILFVIDATNFKPGDSGRIWIRRAELQH